MYYNVNVPLLEHVTDAYWVVATLPVVLGGLLVLHVAGDVCLGLPLVPGLPLVGVQPVPGSLGEVAEDSVGIVIQVKTVLVLSLVLRRSN